MSVKQTSIWWNGVLSDPIKLDRWLIRLYYNEFDAYLRFLDFAGRYCVENSEEWHLFKFLSLQELRHAEMVLEVIKARRLSLERVNGVERYWDCVLPCIKDGITAAGVGALAEGLSLSRMRVILKDKNTPSDLVTLFSLIEPDEGVHAKVLGVLAGKFGMKSVMDCHNRGLEALGLRIKR